MSPSSNLVKFCLYDGLIVPYPRSDTVGRNYVVPCPIGKDNPTKWAICRGNSLGECGGCTAASIMGRTVRSTAAESNTESSSGMKFVELFLFNDAKQHRVKTAGFYQQFYKVKFRVQYQISTTHFLLFVMPLTFWGHP